MSDLHHNDLFGIDDDLPEISDEVAEVNNLKIKLLAVEADLADHKAELAHASAELAAVSRDLTNAKLFLGAVIWLQDGHTVCIPHSLLYRAKAFTLVRSDDSFDDNVTFSAVEVQ